MMYRYATTSRIGSGSRNRGQGQVRPDEQTLSGGINRRQARLATSGRESIRHDLVARVRQEIAAGIYDTPEKLELALERMLDRLDLG